ncbi:MAG: two-component regulator propeller domain-containing protein [Candidatus Omnitrophota bacterium]
MNALTPGKKLTQYRLQVWNMESGLPDNNVLAIRQTRDGYLWIGTQDGLVRFDGFNFQLFNKENVVQLKDNQIRALYEDKHGALWIGTSSGGLVCYNDGEFTAYPIEKYKSLYKIKAISGDRWGNLWVGSYTDGLSCLKGNTLTTYTTRQGLPHNQINAITKDSHNDLWITTAGGIVKLIGPGTFQICVKSQHATFNMLASLYKEDRKEFWIGTADNFLFRFQNGQLESYQEKAGIPYATIPCLFEDRTRDLWIGTDGGGLIRMENGVFSSLSVRNGLAADYVSCVYEDREGSLWVGTLDGGLHQLRDSNFTIYTSREGLSDDYIECVYPDREGHLWIGTKVGLNRFKLKGQESSSPDDTISPLCEGLLKDLKCLYEDPAGYLWIGTWGGLYRYKNGKLTSLTQKNGLSDLKINCIYGDREGNTWIGTQEVLIRYTPTGKCDTYTTLDGLSSNFIQFIFEDRQGNLWVGTNRGLSVLKDGRTYRWAKTSMGSYSFHCAYEDKQGTLWFGTDKGLLRLTTQKKTCMYHIQHGLIENGIHAILEDDCGYLWLAGKNGISRISKNELEDFSMGKIRVLHPDRFNEKDGMKSRWCTGSSCKTPDGRLWFSTSLGVTMIDPNHIKINRIPPSLAIEKFIVDGAPVNIQRFCGGQRGAVFSKRAPLELSPGKKRFEFYYTGISFINPKKIRFKVKLEGYDKDWVEMGSLRNTTYTSLSPGNYIFKVIACNSDGVWNRAGLPLSFYLRPYFYQTPWFYVLVVFMVFFSAFFFYRFRVQLLRVRARELELMVEERTIELAAKNEELSRLSNLDPLTGIANRRRFMEYLTEEWQRQMRRAGTIAMMMIDVDFFKKYNDTYGHQAGDDCLKKTAEVIASAARRPGDLAARYGGEEFVVVLSDASQEGASQVAENIRVGVEALQIPHSSSTGGVVTISLGLAVAVPRQGERMEDLISLADQALYMAKKGGRNRVHGDGS